MKSNKFVKIEMHSMQDISDLHFDILNNYIFISIKKINIWKSWLKRFLKIYFN